MNIKKVILIRTYTAFAFMLLFAAAIVWCLIKIQFVEKSKWISMAENLSTSTQVIEPSRGNIFSSDGSLLATSLPIYDLRIDGKAPAFKDDELFSNQVDSLALMLSKTFGDRSKEEYKRILKSVRKRGDRYYLLKRKVSYAEMKQVVRFPLFRMGKYKGGLTVEAKNRRVKPFDFLAERTIGYSVTGIAPVGIEGAFNKELSGKSGRRMLQRIAGGTWIPVNNEEIQQDAINGLDVVTTLDVNLQDVAEHALMNTLVANKAEWGTAILLEVSTGEIKALANLTRVSEGVYTEKFNYAVGESLEPGSTFKLVSMLALLDDNKAKLTDLFDTENGVKRFFANATMYDSEAGGHGIVNLQQAFEVSSNVATSKAVYQAYKSEPDKFYAHLKALKLTEPLGLQLSGEGKPHIKKPGDKDWYGTTLPWSSIGYEVKVTPLQVATLYNAIANNGKMVKPLFVKEILKTGTPVKKFPVTVVVDQVCKPSTRSQLLTMLKGVVNHGTATNLKNPNYTVAGKTGTALVADGRRGYAQKVYRSSFCGFFPAENPKYTCMVMVNAPSNGIYYGSAVAGPVFKEIADKVFANSASLHPELRYVIHTDQPLFPTINPGYRDDLIEILNALSISVHRPDSGEEETANPWTSLKPAGTFFVANTHPVKKRTMPSLKGMGLRDALYLLENEGLKVVVEGAGKVTEQSVAAGQTISKGMLIKLKLS